jgi:transcriptional regulator with XRE-family HTH domain
MSKWTEEDKRILQEYYGKVPIAEIARMTGKDKNAIRVYAGKHGLSKPVLLLTKKDKKLIENNFRTMKYADIAKELNTSKSSVKRYLQKKGLQKDYTERWTEEDVDFLKTNYSTMSAKEMSRHLGRTVNSIHQHASAKGVLKRTNLLTEKDLIEKDLKHPILTFLKNKRVEKKIARKRLSKLANISYACLQDIESGRNMPTLRVFLKIADALGYELILKNKKNKKHEIN